MINTTVTDPICIDVFIYINPICIDVFIYILMVVYSSLFTLPASLHTSLHTDASTPMHPQVRDRKAGSSWVPRTAVPDKVRKAALGALVNAKGERALAVLSKVCDWLNGD